MSSPKHPPLSLPIVGPEPRDKPFDQNELFCDGAKCSLMRNGIPLLRDEYGHLSEYGSLLLGELFVPWAKANAPGILR